MLFSAFIAPCALGSGIGTSVALGAGLRVVAKTGDAATIAGAGATFGGLEKAEINSQGDVLFQSSLLGPGVSFENNLLLAVERPNGEMRSVARTGSTAVEAPGGSIFIGFAEIMISDAGQVVFEASMKPPGNDSIRYDTLWSESGGLHLVDFGMTQHYLPGGYSGTALRIDDMDHAGRVLYATSSVNFSGSVFSYGHPSWWLAAPDNSNRLVVREGSSHTIPPEPPFTYSFVFESPMLSNGGRVVFGAQLTGSGINTSNNDTIWVDDNGNGQIVYRDGQAALGMPSGVVFTQVRDPYSNETGNIAFYATIAGPGVDASNSKALFSNAGGTLHPVARMGQLVPGIGTLDDSMYLQEIAGASTSFYAYYSSAADGGFGEGVFVEKNGTLRAIIHSGQPAPGIAGYTLLGSGQVQAVPGTERFVVQTQASDENSVQYGGIWVENEYHSLIPVLVGGSQVQLGDTAKTAEWVWMGEFNSRGELPLTVHFTDDTSAVLVWDGSLSSLVVPGDYNSNGRVDAADYTVWRDTLGSRSDLRANGNNMGASAGVVDQADFIVWKSHYGETVFSDSGAGSLALVPEPASLPFGLLILVMPFGRNRSRTSMCLNCAADGYARMAEE